MPSIDKNATDQGVKFSSSNQFMPMAKKDKKIFSRSQKSHHLQDPEAELPMLPGNGNQVMFTSSLRLFISNDVCFIVTFSLLHLCIFDRFYLTSRLLPVRRLQTSVLSFSPWLWFTSLPKPCLWNPFNDKWNEGIGPPLGCHSALLFMLRDQSGAGGSNCKPSITSPSWLTCISGSL